MVYGLWCMVYGVWCMVYYEVLSPGLDLGLGGITCLQLQIVIVCVVSITLYHCYIYHGILCFMCVSSIADVRLDVERAKGRRTAEAVGLLGSSMYIPIAINMTLTITMTITKTICIIYNYSSGFRVRLGVASPSRGAARAGALCCACGRAVYLER